jgi:hypothetical protein
MKRILAAPGPFKTSRAGYPALLLLFIKQNYSVPERYGNGLFVIGEFHNLFSFITGEV